MTLLRVSAAALVAALMLGTALPASAEGAGAGGAESAGTGPNQNRIFDRNRPNRGGPARQEAFERRGSYAYYNGHRGYRDRRDGYREHNGFWFPAAAFAVGAILGGALASPPPVAVSSGNPHVDWCRAHYRTYNPYDNTFQPYGGPRAYCRSPYG